MLKDAEKVQRTVSSTMGDAWSDSDKSVRTSAYSRTRAIDARHEGVDHCRVRFGRQKLGHVCDLSPVICNDDDDDDDDDDGFKR